MWPVYAFLRAEARLALKEHEAAARIYWETIELAVQESKSDSLGGHALAAFALYRWLKLHDGTLAPSVSQVRTLSDWADKLMPTRLARSVFQKDPLSPVLPRLALLEEQIYHALAALALKVGLEEHAARHYVQYLSSLRSETSPPETDPLYRLVIDRGFATQDRIALFRGQRLFGMRNRKSRRAALSYFQAASKTEDEQVSLEAKYWLARASGSAMSKDEKSELYEEVYQYASSDLLSHSAVFWNALLNDFGGERFKAYLERLIEEYPEADLTDQALFMLAISAQANEGLEASLGWFQKLRDFKGENDRLDSASLLPALGYIWRRTPEDLAKAQVLLRDYLKAHPKGALINRARFWLGRIAETLGQKDEAARHFAECIRLHPYDFYGVRARMHLAQGKAARAHLFIQDAKTRDELRAGHRQAAALSPAGEKRNVYRERTEASIASGLYAMALSGEERLRRIDASKRLQDFSADELAAHGLFTRIAVMLALRQEARVAVDIDRRIPNRLAFAERLGRQASDTTLSLSLVEAGFVTYSPMRSALMQATGYLRTAYPVVFKDRLPAAAKTYDAPLPLLYAVMRNESRFYPAALSSSQALGLFQFIPKTFNWLDTGINNADGSEGWHLLRSSGAANRVAFLTDPGRSIDLGARWFGRYQIPDHGREHPVRSDGAPFRHQAGGELDQDLDRTRLARRRRAHGRVLPDP